jgi:hypothetical protein
MKAFLATVDEVYPTNTAIPPKEGKDAISIYSKSPKFESATLVDYVVSVEGRTITQIYGKYLEPISIILLLIIVFLRRRKF